MAALPACSDLAAPSSCAPCLFSAENTYLEYPYHVVPITVDIVPYVWQLSNGTNTTYISSITQATVAVETLYHPGDTPVWEVDGVTLTSGTSYAYFTNFVGAAPTGGCADQVANSDIELPATANPSSLIYPLPVGNAQYIPPATETAVLNYLGSLQTVVAQLGGNEPAVCPSTITTNPEPTACISTLLSTTITCYDYLYGDAKCETQTMAVKRTVPLLQARQETKAPIPSSPPTPPFNNSSVPVTTAITPQILTSTVSPESTRLPETTGSPSTISASSSTILTTTTPLPPSTSFSSVDSLTFTTFPSSSEAQTTISTSESFPLSQTSSSSSSPATSILSSTTTLSTTSTDSGAISLSTASSSAEQTPTPVSEPAIPSPSSSSSSSSVPTPSASTTLTITSTESGTVVLSTIVIGLTSQPQPQSDGLSSSAIQSGPGSLPPAETKSAGSGIGSLTPRNQPPTFTSPPTITSSTSTSQANPMVQSEVLGTTTTTTITSYGTASTGSSRLSQSIESSGSLASPTIASSESSIEVFMKPSETGLEPMPTIDTSSRLSETGLEPMPIVNGTSSTLPDPQSTTPSLLSTTPEVSLSGGIVVTYTPSPEAFTSNGIVITRTFAPTISTSGGVEVTYYPSPKPQVHSTTITLSAGPNGTSVTVSLYTGAANERAAIPVGGVFGFLVGLIAAM